MSMSKKHYEAVAAITNSVLWAPYSDPSTVVAYAARLADYFASENDRFDRQRFMTACLKDPITEPSQGWDAYKAERARLGI